MDSPPELAFEFKEELKKIQKLRKKTEGALKELSAFQKYMNGIIETTTETNSKINSILSLSRDQVTSDPSANEVFSLILTEETSLNKSLKALDQNWVISKQIKRQVDVRLHFISNMTRMNWITIWNEKELKEKAEDIQELLRMRDESQDSLVALNDEIQRVKFRWGEHTSLEAQKQIEDMEKEFNADLIALNEMTLGILSKNEIESEIESLAVSFASVLRSFANSVDESNLP